MELHLEAADGCGSRINHRGGGVGGNSRYSLVYTFDGDDFAIARGWRKQYVDAAYRFMIRFTLFTGGPIEGLCAVKMSRERQAIIGIRSRN